MHSSTRIIRKTIFYIFSLILLLLSHTALSWRLKIFIGSASTRTCSSAAANHINVSTKRILLWDTRHNRSVSSGSWRHLRDYTSSLSLRYIRKFLTLFNRSSLKIVKASNMFYQVWLLTKRKSYPKGFKASSGNPFMWFTSLAVITFMCVCMCIARHKPTFACLETMEAHGTKFMIFFLLQRDSNFFNFTEFIRITLQKWNWVL